MARAAASVSAETEGKRCPDRKGPYRPGPEKNAIAWRAEYNNILIQFFKLRRSERKRSAGKRCKHILPLELDEVLRGDKISLPCLVGDRPNLTAGHLRQDKSDL